VAATVSTLVARGLEHDQDQQRRCESGVHPAEETIVAVVEAVGAEGHRGVGRRGEAEAGAFSGAEPLGVDGCARTTGRRSDGREMKMSVSRSAVGPPGREAAWSGSGADGGRPGTIGTPLPGNRSRQSTTTAAPATPALHIPARPPT
jgi:hypothetical protein